MNLWPQIYYYFYLSRYFGMILTALSLEYSLTDFLITEEQELVIVKRLIFG